MSEEIKPLVTAPRKSKAPRAAPRKSKAPRAAPRKSKAPRAAPRKAKAPWAAPRKAKAPRAAPRKGPEALKIPETIGACADLLSDIRTQRLALEKEAEEWHKQETALTEHIIRVLPKTDTVSGGKHHQVQVITKVKPRVTDWPALFKYVKRTGAFELLQRRLSEGPVQERWENGKQIPGVETFNIVSLSLTKV